MIFAVVLHDSPGSAGGNEHTQTAHQHETIGGKIVPGRFIGAFYFPEIHKDRISFLFLQGQPVGSHLPGCTDINYGTRFVSNKKQSPGNPQPGIPVFCIVAHLLPFLGRGEHKLAKNIFNKSSFCAEIQEFNLCEVLILLGLANGVVFEETEVVYPGVF